MAGWIHGINIRKGKGKKGGKVMHAPTLERKRVVMRVMMYHGQFQMMKQR
jgi:hypothetical protein